MSLFLFYQFFTKIPKDLIDAAKVDGASACSKPISAYWSASFPPVIATVAILQFLEFKTAIRWPVMVTAQP